MMQEPKIQIKDREAEIFMDTAKPLSERKEAFKRHQKLMMNPKPEEEFDPETFDPMDDHPEYEVGKRERKDPPRRLPTLGLKPKEVIEGQLVGMFESKQDLYLLIAWLSNRVSDLEDELAKRDQVEKPKQDIRNKL